MIGSLLLAAFAAAVLGSITSTQRNQLVGGDGAPTDMEFEILKNIEIERIKSRILSELGMTEPPKFSDPPNSLSPDVIKMLVQEDGEKTLAHQPVNVANLMVFPENSDFECEWSNATSCRRFEFRVSPNAMISTSEFWIHQLGSTDEENLTVSVLCSDSERELLHEKTEVQFSSQDVAEKWVVRRLPVLKNLKMWKQDILCEIETSGVIVDNREPNLPFLKMNEGTGKQFRERRNEGRQNTCKSIPFNVSFEAVGFGHWVIHPTWYIANFCKGYCLHVQSHYENLMDMLFQHHPTMEEEFGRCWATCCRPKEYQSMMLIYRSENNTSVVRNLTDVIATSCSCS